MNPAAGAPIPSSTQTSPYAISPEALSALADGEMRWSEVQAACGACTADARAMADWHAWHLIGDVLRSDDLATAPGHDAAFLSALRGRLAEEPVVLAPSGATRAAPAAGRTAAWQRLGLVPSAMAAGFALVAAGLIGMRLLGPAPAPAPAYAQAGTGGGAQPVSVVVETPSQRVRPDGARGVEPQVMVANSKLIRDARLDRYLAAHQQFAGDSALSVPTAFLRNATVDAPR